MCPLKACRRAVNGEQRAYIHDDKRNRVTVPGAAEAQPFSQEGVCSGDQPALQPHQQKPKRAALDGDGRVMLTVDGSEYNARCYVCTYWEARLGTFLLGSFDGLYRPVGRPGCSFKGATSWDTSVT